MKLGLGLSIPGVANSRPRKAFAYTPGTVGNFAATPNTAALQISGDLDLRVLVALDDWTPSSNMALLAKQQFSSTISCYLRIEATTGAVRLVLSNDGSTGVGAASSVGTGVTDGAPAWIRATWRQSDGRVQFFTSTNLADSDGTQLGTDQTIAIASIHSNTSQLELASRQANGADRAAGRFFAAQVRSGIGGSPVFDWDLTRDGRSGTITTAATGQTVTYTGMTFGVA